MKINCKKLLMISLIILGLITLVGCSDNDDSTDSSSYSVSGEIIDSEDTGVEGVILNFSNADGTAKTNQNGQWSKSGLKDNNLITPAKDNYWFNPESRTVSKESGDINFIANKEPDLNNLTPNPKQATFTGVTTENEDSILIHPNAASAAKCYEPEYIAISADSKTAWVTLQENNAVAVVDIESQEIIKVIGLGFKDHSQTGNGLDASHKDEQINIATYQNLYGIYQPDSIAYFNIDGVDYIFTANEGEDLWVGDTDDELDAEDVTMDSSVTNASDFSDKEKVGKLGIYKYLGDDDNDGNHENLYAFGARSFSIWDKDAEQVYDSGDQIEQKVAEYVDNDYTKFNLDNNDEEMKAEKESDNSGPSPEGIDVGRVGTKVFAFIGLEKIGGVMVYDVSTPHSPAYMSYNNDTRDLEATETQMENNNAGDLGPEGIKFVSANHSPIDKPLLLVSYEISGTVGIFEVNTDGTLDLSGRYTTGSEFDEGGAEIVNYDYKTQKLLLVNGDKKSLDIVDISNLTAGSVDNYTENDDSRIRISDLADQLNGFSADDVTCVAVHPAGGLAAIAVPAENPASNRGKVLFFDTENEKLITDIEVGYLPDMLTFTPDGSKVLVANEGEPEYQEVDGEEVSGYYNQTPANDPEGSISIISLY